MKKIFILAGELSGDRLAAWYVQRLKKQEPDIYLEGIGGNFLSAEGVALYQHFETLNVTGIIEIIAQLPKILKFLSQINNYILAQNFDEVVLVDFPGFNLRLAKMLKSKNPEVKITYLSPPQLWCWGAWRIKKLKQNSDRIIVLYPFEVTWYAQRGVTVEWLGNPVYQVLEPYYSKISDKTHSIALLPGSRKGELERLLPLFLKTAAMLKQKHPELSFILPVAQSVNENFFIELVKKHNLMSIWTSVIVIQDEHEKYQALARCGAALSKPGTVTLELALLKVPTIIAFTTSRLTYFIAWLVVKVPFMGLPNLFLNKEIFKEFIQYGCQPESLSVALERLYLNFCSKNKEYTQTITELEKIIDKLSSD